MDSILTTVKQHLGIVAEYEHFDPEIIDHINSVFADLHQMGVGPVEVFMIEDDIPTWEDFIKGNDKLNPVKSYMKLRVKVLFEHPSGSVMDAMQREIDKWEWRLNVAAETKN